MGTPDGALAGRGARARRSAAGFTLIELLIVVAIIGLIAAIAIPNLQSAMNKAKQSRTLADMKAIGNALESYAVENNTYPKGLTDANAQVLSTYVAIYLVTVP